MKPNYTGRLPDSKAVIDAKYESRQPRRQLAREGSGAHRHGATPEDFVGVLEGFRLALDMDGSAEPAVKNAPSALALELAAEQQKERAKRRKRAEIPTS